MSRQIRKKQLRKAGCWVIRHEAEVFVDVIMNRILEDAIREGLVSPVGNSCVIKKVTPDGEAWFDLNVTVPYKSIRMEAKVE